LHRGIRNPYEAKTTAKGHSYLSIQHLDLQFGRDIVRGRHFGGCRVLVEKGADGCVDEFISSRKFLCGAQGTLRLATICYAFLSRASTCTDDAKPFRMLAFSRHTKPVSLSSRTTTHRIPILVSPLHKMATLYALGSNGNGQLGIGHKEDVSVPKPVVFEDLPGKKLDEHIVIRAGGNHTLLQAGKNVLCAGDSSTGACAMQTQTTFHGAIFKRLVPGAEVSDDSTQSNITLCAATWEASFIVKDTAHGDTSEVYSFGTGNKGELGLGEFIFRSPKAQLIKDFPPAGTKIVDVAASVSHVVAVLSNGDVYGWGNGRKGQLGVPDCIIHSPRKISGINFKVVRAACGREFTYLIGSPEDGSHMLLGSDKFLVRSSAPSDVKGWKDVGASWGSAFVLLESGKLLSWGRDDHGQLAPDHLPDLAEIAVGSEHVVALSKAEDVLAWGWGEHGNCGPKTEQGDVKGRWNVIASAQHLPPGYGVTHIGAGCATSWVCVSEV
jgi:protein ATS1